MNQVNQWAVVIAMLCVMPGLSGCSPGYILAKINLDKAYHKVQQADEIKLRKAPFAKRQKLYAEACGYFVAAYDAGKQFFWHSEIEAAERACFMAEDREHADLFAQYGEEYAKAHPQETDYGAGFSGIE
jgi:hypothetical protein